MRASQDVWWTMASRCAEMRLALEQGGLMMTKRQVVFSEVACCAMVHAFLRNPQMTRQWGRTIGKFHLLYEIFGQTREMTLAPDEQTAIVYRAFAIAERDRLVHHVGAERLVCAHRAVTHREALEGIIAMLPCPD
ncbi:MAG: hypothetical protein IT405_00765 [Candidatus Yanofskybacteria bacterium]|nr:hypothetical protein [Candidatus Yanofskybacteria bacterium]